MSSRFPLKKDSETSEKHQNMCGNVWKSHTKPKKRTPQSKTLATTPPTKKTVLISPTLAPTHPNQDVLYSFETEARHFAKRVTHQLLSGSFKDAELALKDLAEYRVSRGRQQADKGNRPSICGLFLEFFSLQNMSLSLNNDQLAEKRPNAWGSD